MARTYGRIPLTWWDDPVARRLPADAERALFYFGSGPQSNASGTYIISMPIMMDHLRWPEDRLLQSLHALSKLPWALWDSDSRVLYQPEWYRKLGNRLENSSIAINIARLLMGLPDCEYKGRAIDDLLQQAAFRSHIESVVKDWRWTGAERVPDLFAGRLPAVLSKTTEPDAEAPPARATRLPEDWQAPAEYRTWARGKGLGEAQIDTELRKFHRFHASGDGKPRKNHYAAWQNWLENVRPLNGNGHTNGNGHAPADQFTWKDVSGFQVAGDMAMHKDGKRTFDAMWIPRAEGWQVRKFWIASWGPEPGKSGCKCPPELLAPID